MTLLIADDHPVFRHGLSRILAAAGHKVVAEASDGLEAVEAARQSRPDVIILDFSMPKRNGVDAAREILNAQPGARIVLLTVHREEQYVEQALAAGIRGYVLKSDAMATLTEAIQEVSRGNTFIAPMLSSAHVARFAANSRQNASDVLTPRELQVLKLIAEGNTTREVSVKLGVTAKTAESYRTSLMQKLDIHDVAGLVRYAVRRGLVTP